LIGGGGDPREPGQAPGPITIDAELLAEFGHQLRNHLNAVVGAAGLMLAGAASNEERELAAIVQMGAEQVSRLVDDVLDAASLETGKLELAPHPFDVRACVETCLALVSDAAGAKGLDLSLDAGPQVPRVVVGDSRRLEEILMTLLHGGVERTFRGGVGVELGSEDRGPTVALHFKIRDTGRGVPARILRNALTGTPGAFDRLEPGDKLAVLSLQTTKRLVELMNGELGVEQGGVEAGPDAGTAFQFTILAEALPPAVVPIPLTLEAMRVLVISSDPVEKRVLALQAEQWGAVAMAVSPAEAVELLRTGRPFDIALVEHRPAEVDGLAISSTLRALRRPEQLPVVMISAETAGEPEARAAASGMIQATLTKPVAPHVLHDVMLQIGAHSGTPPLPHSAADAEAAPGTLRILIADDNSLNQNLLRRLVSSLGHKVDVVSNGREAVAAVAQHPYDVVLMDVLMPEMDGLAAAEAICRRWPRGNRPRLVALTGLAGPGDRERCLKAGYDDYMSKPVHLADLVETFKSVAGSRTRLEPSAG